MLRSEKKLNHVLIFRKNLGGQTLNIVNFPLHFHFLRAFFPVSILFKAKISKFSPPVESQQLVKCTATEWIRTITADAIRVSIKTAIYCCISVPTLVVVTDAERNNPPLYMYFLSLNCNIKVNNVLEFFKIGKLDCFLTPLFIELEEIKFTLFFLVGYI